jgi:hypothetical protein
MILLLPMKRFKAKSFKCDYLVFWKCDRYLGFAEKVRAKHSDRKSTVSPIGYCPNASPLQDAGRWRRKVLKHDSLKILHLFHEKSHKTLTLPTFHIYSANPTYEEFVASGELDRDRSSWVVDQEIGYYKRCPKNHLLPHKLFCRVQSG